MDNLDNIFGEAIELSQRIQANQSVLPKTTYTFPREAEKTDGILPTLAKILQVQQTILDGQKDIQDRLKKVEENQNVIMENQRFLSNGQAALQPNQESIAGSLERCEKNNAPKSEVMAQSKLLMECKVSIRKVEQTVCRMTGETVDHTINEAAGMLPLKSTEEVEVAETKIKSADFAGAVKTVMFKTKGMSEDVSEVLRKLMTDDLLDEFNWDGRCGKRAIGNLGLITNLLREVFPQQSAIQFEKNIKKALDKSHHRQKQKIYAKKNKNQP